MATSRTRKKPTRTRSAEDKSSQLIDYVETLVTLTEQDPIIEADPTPKIEPPIEVNKLDKSLDEKLGDVAANFELQLEQFLINLDLKLQGFLTQLPTSLATGCSFGPDSSTAFEVEEDTDIESDNLALDDCSNLLSDWDRRKQQMLAEHGMSGDEIAEQTIVVKTTSKKSVPKKSKTSSVTSVNSGEPLDQRQPPRLGGCEEGHALEALHDSIAQLDKIDSAEIETLKEQLTSKLRDAEVELSINRAKLSQQWAALEQKQCEMTQRETALKSKYGNLTEATKKAGLLDRLSRHLTRRADDGSR